MVSIIVPFYNAEESIEICLKSIQRQTYRNLEIILIDDGSVDNGYKKCRLIAENDERILIIRQDNKGVSTARNIGLDKMKGKYCCFVDADDYIEDSYVEYLLTNLEKSDSDISTCAYYIEYKKDNWRIGTKGSEQCLNLEQGLINFFSKKGMKGAPYCKLFKTEIIKKYGIRFDERIRMAEDKLFCYEYLVRCKKIFFSSIPQYYYVLNMQSASNKKYITNNMHDSNLPFKTLWKIEETIYNYSDDVVSYYKAFSTKIYIRMVFKYNLFNYLSREDIEYIRNFIREGYKNGAYVELLNSKKNYFFGLVMISSVNMTKCLCSIKRLIKRKL